GTPGARRPRMIAFNSCERILIENLKLMNSPMFHIAISGKSTNTTVRGVTIRATPSTDPTNPSHNTDACDVSGSHILVENCDISNLTYHNLRMTNVGYPILIYASYMATDRQYRNLNGLTPEIATSYPPQPLGYRTPIYRDITFTNITATTMPGRRAGLIWGLP